MYADKIITALINMQQIIEYLRVLLLFFPQYPSKLRGKMTQPIIKKDKIEKGKLQEQERYHVQITPKYMTDRCIHTTAWILLIVGLCILATSFYLAILSQAARTDNNGPGKNDDEIFLEFNRSMSRAIDAEIIEPNVVDGCMEVLCNIKCMETKNIFENLHLTLSQSTCTSTTVLLIQNQTFPASTLRNKWISMDHPVLELFITSSDITFIRSNAFNTPLFAQTFLLSLYKLTLSDVDSGALLGLYELKYLTIDSKVEKLDSAFFQPVQTTLTYLKLTAGLKFDKDSCIFGTNVFPRLQYMDLSRNTFNIPLKRKLFRYMPNLNTLIITNAKITSIEENTFKDMRNRLRLLNLSYNLLTTVSSDLLTPLLLDNPYSLISLAGNSWRCDCDIQPLVEMYGTYKTQFIDSLYCKLPSRLYGTFINFVNYTQEGCLPAESTTPAIEFTNNNTITTTTKTFYDGTTDNHHTNDIDSLKNTTSSEEDYSKENTVFQMRCLNLPESKGHESGNSMVIQNSVSHENSPIIESLFGNKKMDTSKTISMDFETIDTDFVNEMGKDIENFSNNDDYDYMRFEPPTREFDLHLFPNQSARLTIDDFTPSKPINIIWFSEQLETQVLKNEAMDVDYNCMGYENPSVIINDLIENTTYTFCLIPNNEYTITPFNCLPLHVPMEGHRDDNIWISSDQKQFTVGILCLIFMLSLFFGAVIGYFGIKAYPDLLEGSKNVLIVKKSDQTCYVSTISECEYLKNSSIKKKPMGSSLKKNSLKPPLPETPTSHPSLYNTSSKGFERLNSSKSSSTYFEDPFTPTSLFAPPIPFPEDEYEMPKSYDKNKQYEVRCVPNNYGMSPGSPPPLPKRNSNISDATISIVANRFSKAE